MQFQVVAHACLLVEAAGVHLVVDPWIQGPVYWGSWWHWPDPVFDASIFDAEFLYLTHWHFDHFHPESLARFNKRAHVVIAGFPVSTLANQLRALGFTKITELKQAQTLQLAPGFTLTSYQVRHEDDSVAVIEADGTVLVDLNDAKPLASTWRKLRARHPHVDFMLRSHSPAWSYPTCYSFEDASQRFEISGRSYIDAFVAAADILEPRYAVPFASGVCHLHRDVLGQNAEMITTDQVAAVWRERPHRKTELKIMPPGSRWSTEEGFVCAETIDVATHVARLQQREAARLQALYLEEASQRYRFENFERFFVEFLRRAGWVARWVGVHWTFRVTQDAHEEFWSVDFRRRLVTRDATEPTSTTSLITVPAAVLNAAVRDYIFSNIDISKRWRVHIRRSGAMRHVVAMIVVGWFEAGYFEGRNVFTARAIAGLARRLPEALDYAKLALRLLLRDREAVTKAVTDPL
jgi:UDP-MurNAc hydroxylase